MACCDDFRRATAGRGLPAIEPGMPEPAGTGMDRRAFLMRGAGLALSVYGASKLGLDQLEAGVAAAAGSAGAPVLVNVFLPGGLDSLSVLAPIGDARYATLRPTLKLAAGTGTTFAGDTRLMWHPAAAGLAQLHAEGKVSVFPAIGYDHPDQSHFTSRHFWEVGALDPSSRLGWMGRYLDVVGDVDNPLQGLALDPSLAPSLASARVPVAAIAKPSDYSFWSMNVGNPITAPMMEAYGRMGAAAGGASGALDAARTVVRQVDGVRRSLGAFVTADGKPGYTSPVAYPSGDLGARLAALGAMLAAGLPIRCVAVQGVGGYDTHSDQATTLTTNLSRTVSSVVAFQRDLEARGLADRVLIQLWSEFGRRPKENGTGTDHGAAGCAFVIGTRAKGTMVGEFPGLATLDAQSNLRATSDFRTMYCSLLEQWMGIDAAQVIPNAAALGRVALVR